MHGKASYILNFGTQKLSYILILALFELLLFQIKDSHYIEVYNHIIFGAVPKFFFHCIKGRTMPRGSTANLLFKKMLLDNGFFKKYAGKFQTVRRFDRSR